MPIHGYPGNIITANPTEPSQTSASGVWTTEQQLQYQTAGKWPPPYYLISRSLRFNSADSAYLNRTPSSAGNRKTWTWNAWVKRSKIAADFFMLFTAEQDTNNKSQIYFDNNYNLYVYGFGGLTANLITSQVFRDPSSWGMLTISFDTTQATASNRIKVYWNGLQITAFGTATYPSQNADTYVNSTNLHTIGVRATQKDYPYDGYMTEVNFIDGQALTPSSFGENNPDTGVWEPIKYTGTYGTNGFYLNFSDNSGTTATTLGKDYSGNGNNWTPNNFSVTAGAGNDSLVDTPTSYGTDTGAGGEVRGNYCTWNPLDCDTNSGFSVVNGNLQANSGSDSAYTHAGKATIWVSSGKWYWEISGNEIFGITGSTLKPLNDNIYSAATTYGYRANGQKIIAGSASAYGATFTSTDIIGVALDLDAGTLVMYKNNTSQGTLASGLSGSFTPMWMGWGNVSCTVNFGQRPFAYTAPSGFKALCTQNLPTPTIGATSTTQANDYFDVSLYTGNAPSTNTIVNSGGFQPDFVWVKNRTTAGSNHVLVDSVRGNTKGLYSNDTSAEVTDAGFPTITSTGFSVGNSSWANQSTASLIGWQWKGGGTGVTNTAGTITSTVSANTTSGFSIVTYTGTGANATVGHGLGVAPKFIIIKKRSSGTGRNWAAWHTGLGTNVIYLDLTSAAGADSTWMQSTVPTSSVFYVGSAGITNESTAQFVAYCFAPVAGYSAFGSYTGNGSTDGPFVYLGFKPKYLLIRRSDALCGWKIYNTSGLNYNSITTSIEANDSGAEATNATNFNSDWLSNGFKLRTTYADLNTNGGTYIYVAFAENPFKYSLAR